MGYVDGSSDEPTTVLEYSRVLDALLASAFFTATFFPFFFFYFQRGALRLLSPAYVRLFRMACVFSISSGFRDASGGRYGSRGLSSSVE